MKNTFQVLMALFILIINFIVAEPIVHANVIPVGDWGDHLSYNHGTSVIVTKERIYCGTTGGLIYVDREDNSINKLSVINGLSDVYITHLGYDPAEKILVIIYLNGNIDILDDRKNEIINLPVLKNKYLPGDKTIYGITMTNGLAYLSTGFGIVVLNYKNAQINDTYIIGKEAAYLKVNSIAVFNDSIYAGTDEGLYVAGVNNPNLIDYNNWTINNSIPNYRNPATKLLTFENNLLVCTYSDISNRYITYEYNLTSGWQIWQTFSSQVNALQFDHGNILVTMVDTCQSFSPEGQLLNSYPASKPLDCRFDESGNIWIANNKYGGLKCIYPDNTSQNYNPSGPAYSDVSDIENEQGVIWVGSMIERVNDYKNIGMYTYIDGIWRNYNNYTKGSWYGIYNMGSVAIDPTDVIHGYGVVFGLGLAEIRNGEIINLFTPENSIIPPYDESGYNQICRLEYDKNNNLLVFSSYVSQPLLLITPDGQWFHIPFNLGVFSNTILNRDMIATSLNQVWMISRLLGISVVDYNNTPADPSDDKECFFRIVDIDNTFNGADPTCLAEDLDGNIWVGTKTGVIVYSTPYDIFNKDNNTIIGWRPKIPRNDGTNLADLLLDGEEITCIKVDGANRKWIGTKSSGAFLVSSDGLKTVHSFNTGNSPIPSNAIIDIGINSANGEVLFGTELGIVSYQEAATTGHDEYEEVYAFPNPVREDYYGDIVITGLVSESFVKITDISGNIVYETKSLGGQAVWNGRNLSGNRASTGVYLVFMSNGDGSQKFVTKILFIR